LSFLLGLGVGSVIGGIVAGVMVMFLFTVRVTSDE